MGKMDESDDMLGVDLPVPVLWIRSGWRRARWALMGKLEIVSPVQRCAGETPDESEWAIVVRYKSIWCHPLKRCRAELRFKKTEPFQGQGPAHEPPEDFRRPAIDLVWQDALESGHADTKDLYPGECSSLPIAFRRIERKGTPTRAHLKSARFFSRGENELEPGFHYAKLMLRAANNLNWEYPDWIQIVVPDDDQNNGQFAVMAIAKEEYERRLG